MAMALISILLLSSQCQSPDMKAPFDSLQKGLKNDHLESRPLLEKIFCPTGQTSACETMRVYADGALYFLDQRNAADPSWIHATKVKQEGISRLVQIFESLCQVADEKQGGNADGGTVTYRFETTACGREVIIHGVNYGQFYPLESVATIVNSNLEPFQVPK